VTAGRDFRVLAGDPAPDERAREVEPWLHEAANPYLDWMLGSPELATAAIRKWMTKERSEISLSRLVGLYEDGGVVGGYVGLTGAELAAATRADTQALLAVVPREERAGVLRRAAALADLRRPVEEDEWFLSKLGVLESHRRGGRGRAVLDHFLDSGRERGLSRFRLDAWKPDSHVVGMYERAGFRTVAEHESRELGGALLAMTLEDGSAA
jgi:ribosomal protein S18 acetylase RimI-like enzyme